MLSLPARLTLTEANACLRDLETGIRATGGPLVEVDAHALADIDTSALAVLLECQRIAQSAQRRLQVRNAPARLIELAALYGVQGLLDLQ